MVEITQAARALVRKDRVITWQGSDPMIAHDLDTDSFYFIGGVGIQIWTMLDGTSDRNMIVDRLCQSYPEIRRGDMETDCRNFLSSLEQNGLVNEEKKAKEVI